MGCTTGPAVIDKPPRVTDVGAKYGYGYVYMASTTIGLFANGSVGQLVPSY
jgi:hypothetical protein